MSDTSAPIQLDVRVIPPREKHPTIFSTFLALQPGDAFILVNDHDPFPLRYQFEAEYRDQYEWEYLEAGPVVWRVAGHGHGVSPATFDDSGDPLVPDEEIRIVAYRVAAVEDALTPRMAALSATLSAPVVAPVSPEGERILESAAALYESQVAGCS